MNQSVCWPIRTSTSPRLLTSWDLTMPLISPGFSGRLKGAALANFESVIDRFSRPSRRRMRFRASIGRIEAAFDPRIETNRKEDRKSRTEDTEPFPFRRLSRFESDSLRVHSCPLAVFPTLKATSVTERRHSPGRPGKSGQSKTPKTSAKRSNEYCGKFDRFRYLRSLFTDWSTRPSQF